MATHLFEIPIEVSARHVHLSQDDFLTLFGKGTLSVHRTLSQPHQFAAAETVTILSDAHTIDSVRVIGPFRDTTQVELSVTDCYHLRIPPYITLSGDLAQSPGGVHIQGPRGTVTLSSGVIVPRPHIHMSPEQAHSRGLRHLDTVSVYVAGLRPVMFFDVVIRSREDTDMLAFHLDVDQANAIGNVTDARAYITRLS